jgi:hypothetical protein
MQLSSAPPKLTIPFANSGSKNTVPVPSQIGITAGAASYTDGFPPLTMTPVAAGGVPPSGLDMNGVLNEVSAPGVWYSAGGGFPYDAVFSASVGGYPQGARVMRSDGTGYWLNTVDNNVTAPEGSTPTGWVPDFTNGLAAITMISANVTLTPAQYGKPIIVLSGVLTANLNLIFPNIVEDWAVDNNCTGAYTVTCKTAAGTGVAIPAGTTASIYSDGVNVYALYTYGTGTVTQIVAGTDITISPGGGTGVVTINGSNLAAPPPIGNTTPNTGAFTSVVLAGGSALSTNHGNGTAVQHSDGTGTSGNLAAFDANGNVTNATYSQQAGLVGSRTLGTVYYNISGKLMMVSASITQGYGGNTISAYTDTSSSPATVVTVADCAGGSIVGALTFVVLPGNYYKVSTVANASASVESWTEWGI